MVSGFEILGIIKVAANIQNSDLKGAERSQIIKKMKIILVRIVFTEGERWTSKPSSLLTVTRKMGYVWPTLSRVSDSSTPLKKHVFNTTLHSTVNTEPAHGLHNFNFPGSPVETAGL